MPKSNEKKKKNADVQSMIKNHTENKPYYHTKKGNKHYAHNSYSNKWI